MEGEEEEDGFDERCGGLFSADDADLEKLGTENESTIVCLVGRDRQRVKVEGDKDPCYMIVSRKQDGREWQRLKEWWERE